MTDRLCLSAVPPWPPYSGKTIRCVNCGRPVRESDGGSILRRFVHVPSAEIQPGRLPCGSLREHEPHDWTGQTTGLSFTCSGHPPTFPERAQLADQRLHEESNGITDSWREDA